MVKTPKIQKIQKNTKKNTKKIQKYKKIKQSKNCQKLSKNQKSEKNLKKRYLVFQYNGDQSSPVHPVAESWGGTLSVTDGKNPCV